MNQKMKEELEEKIKEKKERENEKKIIEGEEIDFRIDKEFLVDLAMFRENAAIHRKMFTYPKEAVEEALDGPLTDDLKETAKTDAISTQVYFGLLVSKAMGDKELAQHLHDVFGDIEGKVNDPSFYATLDYVLCLRHHIEGGKETVPPEEDREENIETMMERVEENAPRVALPLFMKRLEAVEQTAREMAEENKPKKTKADENIMWG